MILKNVRVMRPFSFPPCTLHKCFIWWKKKCSAVIFLMQVCWGTELLSTGVSQERTLHVIGCIDLGRRFEMRCGSGMLRGGMMQWSNVFTRLLSQSAMMWWVYSMCGWNCVFYFILSVLKTFFFLTVKKKKKVCVPQHFVSLEGVCCWHVPTSVKCFLFTNKFLYLC